jgi:hypothetical protein
LNLAEDLELGQQTEQQEGYSSRIVVSDLGQPEHENARESARSELARADVELVDEAAGDFFAPVASDLVTGLVGQYESMRRKLEAMSQLATGDDYVGALYYFIEGNISEDRRSSRPSVTELFKLDGAIAQLNSDFWQRALQLTDVYDCMPQARRDEWNSSIREKTTPDFTEETVRSTLESLLAARSRFFSERIDGVFRGLSGEHVTNSPAGFSKRMIIGYVLSGDGSWAYVNHGRAGLINDLRCVVAKFMGRDEPKHCTAQPLLAEMRKATGKWHVVDGGAMRIRVYKKGTAHLEVHPDMAWRLNQVLANLYPLAIPSEFRQRPKKRPKDFHLMQRPLPFAVLEILAEPSYGHRPGKVYTLAREAKAKGRAYVEACEVLESLGGVAKGGGAFEFDYIPDPVIDQVIISGCIPDQKAFQFYPTGGKLAKIAVELAQIGPEDQVCEPSAGRGDLARLLPKERTTCVEVAQLQCEILRAQGFNTIQADFLAWAESQSGRWTRVVMNPPFEGGRAKLHVQAAASMLMPGGRLVAILPASMKGKDFLDRCEHEWSRVYDNEFAGTSVSVVLLVASRQA